MLVPSGRLWMMSVANGRLGHDPAQFQHTSEGPVKSVIRAPKWAALRHRGR